MKRLRDLLITVLGLWLMMSPRVLNFPVAHADAAWNTWFVGAAVILMTAVYRYLVDTRSPWEDLACAALGAWLIAAPWVLEFAGRPAEQTNSVIVGCLIVALSLWAMVIDADLRKLIGDWRHQHQVLR